MLRKHNSKFEIRFQDFSAIKKDLDILSTPFNVNNNWRGTNTSRD